MRGLFFINSFAFSLELLLISGSNFYLFFNFLSMSFFCSFFVCVFACLFKRCIFCSSDYFSLFLFIYLFFFLVASICWKSFFFLCTSWYVFFFFFFFFFLNMSLWEKKGYEPRKWHRGVVWVFFGGVPWNF